MKTWSKIEELAPALNGSVVSIGNFDGVHLGHRAILRDTISRAKRFGVRSVAITFDPHPSVVLGVPSPPLLTTPAQRGRWMAEEGIDHFLIQSFTSELSRLSAEDYVRIHLVENLKAKALCIGSNTHLGKGREGTPERLKQIAERFQIECSIAVMVLSDGQPVSSSRIRKLVEQGEVERAGALLGRPHMTEGKVVSGAGRGSALGYPTVNLEPVKTLVPAAGVYATRVRFEESLYVGATNVGVRPTFESSNQRVIETHLLDFKGNLTGTTIEVEWIKRLRPEKKFPSAQDLQRQITEDVAAARAAVDVNAVRKIR